MDGGNTVASVRAPGALRDALGMVAAFSREFLITFSLTLCLLLLLHQCNMISE